jgi:acyl-CoA thioester hydrolase
MRQDGPVGQEPVAGQDDCWLPLRFRDLDAFGHVYHAEYLTLLDEARTRWFGHVGLDEPGGYVLAHLEMDWLSSLGEADRAVRVAFDVEAVGTASVTLRERMCARDGREVARSRSVTVRWDRARSGSRALTPAERSALESLRS